VKIYVAAVEALRKKERQEEDETQFTTKSDHFSNKGESTSFYKYAEILQTFLNWFQITLL
jgi:hypothetical protein